MSSKALYVDVSRQKALLAENNTVVQGFDCIAGAANSQTPLGLFKVSKNVELHVSREFNVDMPWSLFSSESHGIALHQSPWAKTRSYAKYLGIGDPGSHGCVGLADTGDVKAVFEWTPSVRR